MVTHDQDEALLMADRIAVLNRGRVEQYAAPDILYRQPASPFVAAFIGQGNWLPFEGRAGVAWIGERALQVATARPRGQGGCSADRRRSRSIRRRLSPIC